MAYSPKTSRKTSRGREGKWRRRRRETVESGRGRETGGEEEGTWNRAADWLRPAWGQVTRGSVNCITVSVNSLPLEVFLKVFGLYATLIFSLIIIIIIIIIIHVLGNKYTGLLVTITV